MEKANVPSIIYQNDLYDLHDLMSLELGRRDMKNLDKSNNLECLLEIKIFCMLVDIEIKVVDLK